MELDQDVPTHNELDRVRTLVLVEGVRLELGLKLPGLSGGNEHPEVPLVDFSIRLKHAFLFLVRVLKLEKKFHSRKAFKTNPLLVKFKNPLSPSSPYCLLHYFGWDLPAEWHTQRAIKETLP